MRLLPTLAGTISPLRYAIAAPTLLLMQPLGVGCVLRAAGQPISIPDLLLLPLRQLATWHDLPSWLAAASFALSLGVAWALAVVSFRRASWSGGGHVVAALTVVPLFQIGAVLLLAVLPRQQTGRAAQKVGSGSGMVLQGLAAGMAIIVGAVFVSAIGFGSYGWGLFVMTPFLVGMTTGWFANRQVELTTRRTMVLVMAAAALGTLALIGLALEGFFCILLASPLGALVAAAGGALGRAMARGSRHRDTPLMCVALLPALFATEAAMPPMLALDTVERVDIAASPGAVWRALTSDAPIASSAGLVGLAGLATPIRGTLLGQGVGATRLGLFSTGTAVERVTAWTPGRLLAFTVVRQVPAMNEASPYPHVYAPHDIGYFTTSTTSFDLAPIADGHTRLTARAAHLLRIDPVLYWEPLARWAIHQNVTRVLAAIKTQAEKADSYRAVHR